MSIGRVGSTPKRHQRDECHGQKRRFSADANASMAMMRIDRHGVNGIMKVDLSRGLPLVKLFASVLKP